MLNDTTKTVVELLSENTEISVKDAVKFLNSEKNLNVDYRFVYRIFRTHGTLSSKGKFVTKTFAKTTTEDDSDAANHTSSIEAAATSSKAA
jgi:hypothetical protein